MFLGLRLYNGPSNLRVLGLKHHEFCAKHEDANDSPQLYEEAQRLSEEAIFTACDTSRQIGSYFICGGIILLFWAFDRLLLIDKLRKISSKLNSKT